MNKAGLITGEFARWSRHEYVADPQTVRHYSSLVRGLADELPYYYEPGSPTSLDYSKSNEAVVVNALIRHQDDDEEPKYLALKRSDGRWNNVAGFAMGLGRVHPLTTAVTELEQETQVPLSAVDRLELGGIERVQAGSRILNIAKVVIDLAAQEEVVLNDEHSESRWVTEDEYRALDPRIPVATNLIDEFREPRAETTKKDAEFEYADERQQREVELLAGACWDTSYDTHRRKVTLSTGEELHLEDMYKILQDEYGHDESHIDPFNPLPARLYERIIDEGVASHAEVVEAHLNFSVTLGEASVGVDLTAYKELKSEGVTHEQVRDIVELTKARGEELYPTLVHKAYLDLCQKSVSHKRAIDILENVPFIAGYAQQNGAGVLSYWYERDVIEQKVMSHDAFIEIIATSRNEEDPPTPSSDVLHEQEQIAARIAHFSEDIVFRGALYDALSTDDGKPSIVSFDEALEVADAATHSDIEVTQYTHLRSKYGGALPHAQAMEHATAWSEVTTNQHANMLRSGFDHAEIVSFIEAGVLNTIFEHIGVRLMFDRVRKIIDQEDLEVHGGDLILIYDCSGYEEWGYDSYYVEDKRRYNLSQLVRDQAMLERFHLSVDQAADFVEEYLIVRSSSEEDIRKSFEDAINFVLDADNSIEDLIAQQHTQLEREVSEYIKKLHRKNRLRIRRLAVTKEELDMLDKMRAGEL